MKSTARFLAMVAIAAGSLLGAATGCELIANVDRDKIEGNGGTGGTGAQGGGGTSQGGGGTTSIGGGGSTSTGPTCVDPTKDCTPPTDECKVAACDANGECIEENAAEGKLGATQTAGDCTKNVCQSGAIAAIDDDDDPFDDGNDCTTDTCDAGTPTTMPTDPGSACMGTMVCDGLGACVECVMGADCTDPLKTICDQNVCVDAACGNTVKDPNETDVDCGGACAPCDDLLACLVVGDCKSGVCTGMVCQVPTCSDNVENGVETDKDCGGNSGCSKCKATQGCDAGSDCIGAACTGVGGTCTPNCSDTEKNNAETDVDCGGGTCGVCGVGKDCGGSDANCAGNAFCDMVTGKCVADLPLGGACMGTNQCASGFCADGVCCNSACGALCQACNNGGSVGTCGNIGAGLDPASECAGAATCTGNGTCTKAQGVACAGAPECTSGFCTDGLCCDTACSGVCKSCLGLENNGANGTCGNVATNTDPANECAGVLTCAVGGVCATPLMAGSACTVGGECASGFCVDGVCCGSICNATCKACSVAKTGTASGTCADVMLNTDPDNECAGPLNCGAGACLKDLGATCATGPECGSGFCADGVCCNSDCAGTCRSCNGQNGSASGTCSLHPAGSDVGNECSGGGTSDCNGGGACGLGGAGVACVGAGGVCTNGNCGSVTAGFCP